MMSALLDLRDWVLLIVRDITLFKKIVGGPASKFVLVGKEEFIFEGGEIGFGEISDLTESLVAQNVTSVILRLDAGRFFTQDLLPRKLPRSRAHALAILDIGEKFPFIAKGVALFFYNTTAGSKYVAAKVSVIEPIITAFIQSGIRTQSVQVATADGIFDLVSLNYKLPVGHRTNKLAKAASLSVVATLVIVSLGTLGHLFVRNAEAISKLDGDIAIKQSAATEAVKREKIKKEQLRMQQFARSSKVKSRPVWMVWDEVTRLLPDTTWLTDLSVSKGEISIAGYSAAAAELIPVLGSSDLITNVTFASQVTRVPGQEGERFSIRMRASSRD